VSAASVVAVRGVAKAFDQPVLAGVDLTVEPGEIVVLLGRSGSGKTTLLTIVTGFEEPDAGTVERPGEAWDDLAVLPQSLGLLPELTVAENVALPLRLAGKRPDVADLLARLGLTHLADRYPSQTSLGEQQRTALGRAVVVRPRLLVADEPVSHQNRDWAEAMMGLVRELADAGTACLLATHDEVAVVAADRVVELRDGVCFPVGP
jgi:putative ABC transport system ATP-binding protein